MTEGRLYFAYGSNLSLPRLARRVPGARLVETARVDGHRLTWSKRGRDGSGKCTIVAGARAADHVHGALVELPRGGWSALDRFEVGYRRVDVVCRAASRAVAARTYVAHRSVLDEGLEPFVWYRDLVVDGAEALGLPAAYLAALRRVRAVSDPDGARAERNRRHGTPRSA